MEHPNLIVVQSFASHPDAELAKDALESAGIPSMIQADTAGGMREHLAWSGAGFKLLVREEDLGAARDALTPPPANPENDGDPDRPDSQFPGGKFT
jgi:F420-dependent methylenetetrahydromethanopterin dehydrogenase